MKNSEAINKIAELTQKIARLPKGYISQKEVNGKVYYYHQWSEGGVKKSHYLKDAEIKPLSDLIEERKILQAELKEIKSGTLSKSDSPLVCTLMHKRVRVAEIELNTTSGLIVKISKLFSEEHLPTGVAVKGNIPDLRALNNWWADRSIPASRSGVRKALENLNIENTKTLLVRCYGLSLSDQYWICPIHSHLTWKKINFFQNDFSEDIGDILFGAERKKNPLDFSSPDNTSDGNLKKRWKIVDGSRCLIKGGSSPYRQEPLNELIATRIMKKLKVPCVSYSVTWSKGAPYSICNDFIDETTEFVPASRIIRIAKRNNNTSLYQHFLNCAALLGIPGAKEFLDRMIVVDYIIANEDRHLNNFGAIRNAETLEWIGMAPIYDSGSSLGYNKTPALMADRDEIVCKPFKNSHNEQLRLVSDFSWIDFSKLDDIPDMISKTLSVKAAKNYMDEHRIKVIASLTGKRIAYLKRLSPFE